MKAWLRLRRWLDIHSIPADVRVYFALQQGEWWVLDISRRFRVGIGTVYAVLAWGEQVGVIESAFLDEPSPRRRSYRLTEMGRAYVPWIRQRPPYDQHWTQLEALFPVEAQS